MAARRVYEADRAVLDECTRRGVPDITVRKLERWRRYLPDRLVEHRAGLRGSTTSNPPHYVDQVLALAALVKAGMPMREAPVRLFVRGFSVKAHDLREVYSDLYARLRHGLRQDLVSGEADPADRADALAVLHAADMRRRSAGRRWAKRAKQLVARGGALQGDDPDTLFVSALSAMFTWMVAGQQPSAQGVVEALSVAGLNDGQDPEAAGARLAAINLDAVSAAIDAAVEVAWLTARQDMELLAHYVELRRRVDQLWTPDDPVVDGLAELALEDADIRSVLIPVALLFDETWRQNTLNQCQQYAAAGLLLNDMPEKFRPFLLLDRVDQIDGQPEAFRLELQTFLGSWAMAHPAEFAQFQTTIVG
jgi:hypothetical protein